MGWLKESGIVLPLPHISSGVQGSYETLNTYFFHFFCCLIPLNAIWSAIGLYKRVIFRNPCFTKGISTFILKKYLKSLSSRFAELYAEAEALLECVNHCKDRIATPTQHVVQGSYRAPNRVHRVARLSHERPLPWWNSILTCYRNRNRSGLRMFWAYIALLKVSFT